MGIELALFAFSMAMTMMTSQMQKKRAERAMQRLRDQMNQDQDVGRELKANTRGTNEPIKVIYGRLRVGGNTVYIATKGTNNYDLYFSHSIAEGPNKGIVDDDESIPYIWFDGERIFEKYADHYTFIEDFGTSDQTCNTLINTEFEDFTDPMRYVAGVAWYLEYDEDLFRGIPEVQYLYDGRLLYDFRTDTTAWSDNPVLALYDFFTNSRYGIGYDPSVLDLDSWEESADYCDTKEFKINMEVSKTSGSVWDTVTNILNLFRGDLNYWDGKYYLRFRDLNEEVSVMTITDEHIYQDISGKAMVSLSDPGYYNIPNGVEVTFINSENNTYVQDSFVIGEEEGVISSFNAIGCTSKEMAGKLATSDLEQKQLTRTISGRFRDDCLVLEPSDIVTFNSTALSIADQPMRVLSATYTNVGFIDLVLQYESIDIYDDIFNISPETLYTTNLPNPNEPSYIINPTISESIYTQRLRTFSRLKISFTLPEKTWFKHVEVYISTEGDVAENYRHQFNSKTGFDLDPVEEGTTYYIILRTVNIWDVKEPLHNASKLSKTVIGKSNTAPESLPYLEAIPGNGSVSLRSTKLDDPDIEIYEFRVGTQWTGGVFLSAKRSPHEELGLVKTGSHDFWCNTRGTNNLYGLNPQTANVLISIPKGWTYYTAFNDDYTSSAESQVFNNVEHVTYSADDYLKCSHDHGDPYVDSTAGITFLMGQYISKEFDTGVVADTYYVYIDTEFVSVGAGTTWGDIFVDSTTSTWAQINADSRTWKDIFEIESAPKVTMRIWYKAEVAHDWIYVESAQILAGVITARYFKVEINIEDPADNVNVYVRNFSLKLYN